jgi:hypothetical protein
MAAYHGTNDTFYPSQNSDRPDFRDSPLLRHGSGSQAAPSADREIEERIRRLDLTPPFKGQADAASNVQRTLLGTGENLERAMGALGVIETLLDDWEEDVSRPEGQFRAAEYDTRHPSGGIRQVAKGLHAQSLAIGERLAILQGRLSALKDGIGGL